MTDILELIDATLAECSSPHVSAGPPPPSGAQIWAQLHNLTADLPDPAVARGLLSALPEPPAIAGPSPLESFRRMYELLRDQVRPDRGRYIAFTTPGPPRSAAVDAHELAQKTFRLMDDLGLTLAPWQRLFVEDVALSRVEPVDFFRDDAIRFRVAMRYRIQDYGQRLTVDELFAQPAVPRSARIRMLRTEYRHRRLARRRRARR